MSKREPGYYWVRWETRTLLPGEDPWAIFEWLKGGQWELGFKEADFAEIDERRIERVEG